MKKIISLLLIVVLLLSLAACGKTQDTSGANKLVYGEKYVKLRIDDTETPENDVSYYIVKKDCIEKYVYYKSRAILSDEFHIYHYTVRYKYEIMDEGTLAYFYDSIEFHEGHNTDRNSYKQSNGILLFSENVISTTQNDLYVRESYKNNELNSFGK